MRFLITVSSLTPGSGLTRYVFTLCQLLSAGNEVWVMTTHDNGDHSYERMELDKCGNNIHLISLGIKSKIEKYLSALKWIRKIKPHNIINNYNAVIQYLLPFFPGSTKTVHVLHNDTKDFYRVGAINGSRIKGWIAPTESIARRFNEYTEGKYADKIKVISHGVEECEKTSKANTRLEIVYAGVLYEHKGVKVLPEVIRRLLRGGVNLHFTIVGGGILSDWLKEQFAKEIAAGIVTMTGVIPHDDVYEIMAKGDIFLYPTHLDAFGLVIAEAMMNGMVPVVTNLPGITDNLIANREDGFLLEKDNIDSFVCVIKRLSQEPLVLKNLQEKAYKKAVTKLSIRKMRENYKLYFRNDA